MFAKAEIKNISISLILFVLVAGLIVKGNAYLKMEISLLLVCVCIFSGILALKKLDHLLFYSLLILLPFNLEIEITKGIQIAWIEIIAGLNVLSFLIRIIFDSSSEKIDISKSYLGFGIWIFILVLTSMSSSMLIVSVKFTTVWLSYMFIGLVLLPHYLKTERIKLENCVRILAVGIGILALYSLIKFIGYDLERSMAPLIARPFLKDHTALSATISLVVPLQLYLFWISDKKSLSRTIYFLFFLISVAVIFFASSRAAWLGILFSIFMALFLYWKGKWIHLTVLAGIAGLVVFSYAPQIRQSIESNRYNSDAKDSGLKEQALSLTNITSDVSNMERINRWNCAIRMCKDKPLLGFGPGTFQFQYLPYQVKSEMTRISVTKSDNYDDGHGGTAHSEIFLAMSESGIIGLTGLLILWITIYAKSIKTYLNEKNTQKKILSLAIISGVSTYLVHSLFNNFLNIAPFGILFWILVGIIFSFKKENV